jgi:hypothetical protein
MRYFPSPYHRLHVAGFTIDRKRVKAGAIRVAHGAPETHDVKYLGSDRTEYARLELRTEPLDRPTRDVRLPPCSFDIPSAAAQQFENGQLRILRIRCGEILWSPDPISGPMEQVRIELKSLPAKAH